MKVEIISCLQDNYSYLIIDETNNLGIKNLFADLGIFLIEK